MKCKANKECPEFFYSDNRGSCSHKSYCDENTECPLGAIVQSKYNEYLELLEIYRDLLRQSNHFVV